MTDSPTTPSGGSPQDDRASQDPLTRWVSERGCDILLTLNSLGKALKFYSANNKMVERFFSDIKGLFAEFGELGVGPLRIQVTTNTFFINGHIVRLDFTEFSKAKLFSALMLEAGVGEAVFPGNVEPDGLVDFFQALRNAAGNEEAGKRLLLEGVSGITLKPPLKDTTGGGGRGGGQSKLSRFELVLRLYSSLVAEGGRIVDAVQNDRAPNLVRAHRALRLLVDTVSGAETLLTGLISSPWTDVSVGRHSAHVAILATVLGNRVGLDAENLTDLGMAGLLHDIPRMLICHRLPDPLVDLLFLPREQHKGLMQLADAAVGRMLQWPGSGSMIRTALMVVFENRLDFSAKQLYDARTAPHPLTSLIGVVDRYDATLLSRPDLPAQDAVDLVVKQAERRLDPRFASHLVKTVGLFPPATPVRLSSGEPAVVLHPALDSEQVSQPVVLTLSDEPGKCSPGEVVDLADTDLRVVESLPRKYFGYRLRAWFLSHVVSGSE